MKTLTIVICNFNHERYLGEAVASALAQDYPATSVLVIDDGFTDRSVDIIASFGSRVQAVFKANGGQVSAYNLAIELVSSDYAIFLDADDVLYPNAVSEVVRAFEAGEYAKVQFRLDVIAAQGERTGSHVPHSDPPADCARLLRRGWLYPSPPASGNAYCLRALRRVFPVPESKDTRYGADFYAIYGVALVGNVLPIASALGGYRIHHEAVPQDGKPATGTPRLWFANSEDVHKAPKAFSQRWSILQALARARLGEELPPAFHDFSFEKAYFCLRVHRASLASRWRWLALESRSYLHSIVANPFWGVGQKLGALALTSLCLLPSATLSDFAITYIANPLARRPGGGRQRHAGARERAAPGRNQEGR
jgi:glycosyltransferase involved in cell wall biosynthesis